MRVEGLGFRVRGVRVQSGVQGFIQGLGKWFKTGFLDLILSFRASLRA